MRPTWLCTLPLLAAIGGCPKGSARSKAPTSQTVLADWARARLDLRTWRSCARSAVGLDLEQATLVFAIDPAGQVTEHSVEPADQRHDPGMICLAMELAHPPERVPPSGEAHTVRLPASQVHEQPGPGA